MSLFLVFRMGRTEKKKQSLTERLILKKRSQKDKKWEQVSNVQTKKDATWMKRQLR